MTTKENHLSIKSFGLSVSAVLVIIYASILFASLLLVNVGTSGSWHAALLGIGWSTVVGIEMGFVGVVMAGFAFAAIFVPTANFLRRQVFGQSNSLKRLDHLDQPAGRSWSFRLLAALLVLLPLTLLVLRVLPLVISSAAKMGADDVHMQSSGGLPKAVNIGAIINTVQRESEPSFTADGHTMYFNCNNGDICVSHLSGPWEQGNWSLPERLDAPVSTAYEEVEPVINATGDKLYFMSRRPGGRLWRIPFLSPFMDVFRVVNSLATAKLGRSYFGGLGLPDVYVTYRTDGAWSDPVSINDVAGEPPINSEFSDHCLFFSADGNEAFWTSTRPGGFGGNDIWTSHRVDGKWTPPENLGQNVNGPDDEHHSSLTSDNKSLYVTTTREGGYGKEDIYITTRDANGKWGPLTNLGPQINGPGDDRCPAWTPDTRIFLFDSVNRRSIGSRDIWWVSFKDVAGYPLADDAPGTRH